MRCIRRLTLVLLIAAAISAVAKAAPRTPRNRSRSRRRPRRPGRASSRSTRPPSTSSRIPTICTTRRARSLAVPVKVTSPLVAALNTLDGFSTTAVISAPFNAPLDPASLIPWNPLSMAPAAASIIVLNATAGTPLVPGADYTVRISTAAGSGGGLLEIVPLKPLLPRTRYAFIVTNRRPQHGRRRGRRRPRVRRRARCAPRWGTRAFPASPR